MPIITKKQKLAENIFLMNVKAPNIAKNAKPGQFVILRIDEEGERIPLTIAGSNQNEITLVFQAIGKTTKQLSELKKGGNILDLAGPLGKPSDIREYGTVCLVGGGIGAAELLPLAKALKKAKNRIITIIGAKNKKALILVDELKKFSKQLIICTDDGSKGVKGFVTAALEALLKKERLNLVYAVGPTMMMKSVSALTMDKVKTIVSLNPIMVDGIGMCGGCRVIVDGQIRFACVDGPEFNGHQVDWDDLLNRTSYYAEEEKHVCNLRKTK